MRHQIRTKRETAHASPLLCWESDKKGIGKRKRCVAKQKDEKKVYREGGGDKEVGGFGLKGREDGGGAGERWEEEMMEEEEDRVNKGEMSKASCARRVQ